MTAANATDKEQFRFNGQQTVICHNSGVTPRVVTITGVTDRNGRIGDISFTAAAGGIYAVGPQVLRIELFRQSDGMCYLEAAHLDVHWGVIEP